MGRKLYNLPMLGDSIRCMRCSGAVLLPERESALLDERGAIHVACPQCGTELVVGGESIVVPTRSRARRGVSGLLIWLLIVALATLLVPTVSRMTPVREVEQQRHLLT
jgi:DNA-directed RNA polymerase subunit RPC12/RpoP